VRAQQLLPAVIAISCLASTPLASQHPQTRAGFWIGAGYGLGNIAWQCNGCSQQDHGGGSALVRLGVTASHHVLLGAELNGLGSGVGLFESFGVDSMNEKISSSYMAFTVYWYPHAEGGLFLKSGLGASWYDRKQSSSESESRGAALLVGTGYDIRIGQMTSITPMLTFWGSTKADLKSGFTTLATGLRHTGATFQLSITGH